jgi:excisionase family DNA binding protein
MVEKIAFSVREIAEMIGVSDQIVYDNIKAGKFPGNKIGGRYVIFKDDFESWKESSKLTA